MAATTPVTAVAPAPSRSSRRAITTLPSRGQPDAQRQEHDGLQDRKASHADHGEDRLTLGVTPPIEPVDHHPLDDDLQHRSPLSQQRCTEDLPEIRPETRHGFRVGGQVIGADLADPVYQHDPRAVHHDPV